MTSETIANESPPRSDAKSFDRWTDSKDIWIILSLLLVAFAAQIPYYQSLPVWDDLRHLCLIGEAASGRIGWSDFVFRFHNEHFLPAWKLWYVGCWKAFGLNPLGWHLTIALAQALGSISLYKIATLTAVPRISAVVMGTLWAGATFGGFDNPLIWLAASHLTLGTTWVLLATWVALLSSERKIAWGTIPFILLLTLAYLTMSAMALLAMAIPMLLYAKLRDERMPIKMLWLVSWLLPTLAIVSWQLWNMANGQLEAKTDETSRISEMPLLMMGAYGVGLVRLLFGTMPDGLGVPVLLFGASLVGIFFCGRATRKLCLAVGIGTVAYTLAVAHARSAYPPDFFAKLTRFQYVPVLFWCILYGELLGKLWVKWANYGRRWAWISGAVMLVVFCSLQRRQAVQAAADFSRENRPSYQPWLENLELCQELAADSSLTKIPDLPVTSRSFVQPLSGMIAYAALPQWRSQFVSLGEVSEAELQEFETTLQATKNPQGEKWLAVLQLAKQHREFFLQLAAEKQKRIPDKPPLSLPPLYLPLPTTPKMHFVDWGKFCAADLADAIDFSERGPLTQEAVGRLSDLLRNVEHPLARELESVLSESLGQRRSSGP